MPNVRVALAAFACAAIIAAPTASAAPVTFTKLTGLTGGFPAATAVYRADLSGLTSIASLTIQDSGSTTGGAAGQFSGFDLDAVVLSTVLITDAAGVTTLTRAATLDFASSIFVPGSQRPPADPALFGTSGGGVNNAVATLDSFDGDSTTVIPGADGFVSLGDGGKLSINLTSLLTPSGPLYLYIGEVGDNGEVAASNITVSDRPVSVPEPATLLMFGMGLLGLAGIARLTSRPAAAGVMG